MRAVDIIASKRDGMALSAEEIDFVIQGFTTGPIPDYQVAAWLMAIVLQGMDRQETIDLTMAIVRSGEQLDLDMCPLCGRQALDRRRGRQDHPGRRAARGAAGLPVAKMSGRGLGFTGGTLDKLESIPGFRAELTIESFATS